MGGEVDVQTNRSYPFAAVLFNHNNLYDYVVAA